MSHRKRILLVDDDPGSCYILSMVLKLNDFDVAPFTDPELALVNFNKGAFDILLLDIGMPKMNGFELYRKIREIDSDAQVCFVTDYGQQNIAEFSGYQPDLSSKPFVDKPILGSHLVRVLEELLAK